MLVLWLYDIDKLPVSQPNKLFTQELKKDKIVHKIILAFVVNSDRTFQTALSFWNF